MAPVPLADGHPEAHLPACGVDENPATGRKEDPLLKPLRRASPRPGPAARPCTDTAGGGGHAHSWGMPALVCSQLPTRRTRACVHAGGPSPHWLGSQAFTLLYLKPSGDSERLFNSEIG